MRGVRATYTVNENGCCAMSRHDEPKRAACAGMHDLFDSTHPSDHRRAKAICNSPCPIKLQCAQWLKEDMASVGFDPRGTWSGRLVGKPVGRPGRGAAA